MAKNLKGVFSHNSDEWATPKWFYEELNKEFFVEQFDKIYEDKEE